MACADKSASMRTMISQERAGVPDTQLPILWVRVDETLRFGDPSLRELLAFWERKRGTRRMPNRADIDPPFELREHLANLVLIEVHHDPLRMRYRLIGTEITGAMGRDSTGKWYHDIYPPELLAQITESFAWIVRERRPLRSYGQAFYVDKSMYDYEIVNLPLSSDGETVDMVLGKLIFRFAGQEVRPA